MTQAINTAQMNSYIRTSSKNSILLGGGELEPKSIKRIGRSRPKKGIKVVDLAKKRLGRKRPNKNLENMGSVMMVFAFLLGE